MKKIGLISLLILMVLTLYTLLFPVKIVDKTNFKLSREFDIKGQFSANEIDGYYFRGNSECGYFSSDDGMISFRESRPGEYLVANLHGFVTFNKVGSELAFHSPRGELNRIVPNFGYPYMLEESPLVYVLKTNGAGLSLYHIDGRAFYENIQFNALITSISVDKNMRSLVSTVDGKSYLINKEGEFESTFENSGSRIKMSKATAIDTSSDRLAIVSGLDPEFLDIYELETGTKLLRIETKSNFNYASYLDFINNRVYFEGIESLNFYDFNEEREGALGVKGRLVEVTHSANGNILVLTESSYLKHLYLFTPTGLTLYYGEFNESVDNLNFLNNESFYFKLNDKIVKVQRS